MLESPVSVLSQIGKQPSTNLGYLRVCGICAREKYALNSTKSFNNQLLPHCYSHYKFKFCILKITCQCNQSCFLSFD